MLELHHVQSASESELLATLEANSAPFPWSAGMYQSSLASPHDHIIKAIVDGQVIGAAVIMQVLDEAHIHNFFISASFQRQGWGKCFLQQLMNNHFGDDVLTIYLEVRESNHAARQLYLACGFQQTGIRKHYYPTPDQHREHAILMQVTR